MEDLLSTVVQCTLLPCHSCIMPLFCYIVIQSNSAYFVAVGYQTYLVDPFYWPFFCPIMLRKDHSLSLFPLSWPRTHLSSLALSARTLSSPLPAALGIIFCRGSRLLSVPPPASSSATPFHSSRPVSVHQHFHILPCQIPHQDPARNLLPHAVLVCRKVPVFPCWRTRLREPSDTSTRLYAPKASSNNNAARSTERETWCCMELQLLKTTSNDSKQ